MYVSSLVAFGKGMNPEVPYSVIFGDITLFWYFYYNFFCVLQYLKLMYHILQQIIIYFAKLFTVF